MSTNTLASPNTFHFSINMIQEEVRQLIETGIVSRHQPIYILWKYIPAREWLCVEEELERSNYLLRDRIGDLIASQKWDND